MQLTKQFILAILLIVAISSAPVATCFPFRRSAHLSTTTSTRRKSATTVVSKTRGGGITSKFYKDDASTDNNSNPKREKKIYTLLIGRRWAKFLYCLSAMNPLIAVLFNDYTRMLEPLPSLQTQPKNIVAKTVTGAFSFVRFKPRVSFSIGAMLRAFQLNTAFQNVIDPSVGVGFGLNLLCLFAKSRWPATIFLGWSMTKPFWKMLGATPPSTGPVPITVVFNPKSKTATNTDTSSSSSSSLSATTNDPAIGYRIGI